MVYRNRGIALQDPIEMDDLGYHQFRNPAYKQCMLMNKPSNGDFIILFSGLIMRICHLTQ